METYLTRELGLIVRAKALADRQASLDEVVKTFMDHTPTPKSASIHLFVSIENNPENHVHRAPLLGYEVSSNGSVQLSWAGLNNSPAIVATPKCVNLADFKQALLKALLTKYLPHLPDCTVEIHNTHLKTMTVSLVLDLTPR